MIRAHTPRGLAGLAILLVTVLLTSPPMLQAQEKQSLGVIKGTVTDAATQEPLPYTNVLFLKVTGEFPEGTSAGGAMGLADGTFEGKVVPGTYIVEFQFIGYDKVRKEEIVVAPGKTVVVNASLGQGQAIEVETVVVTGEAVRRATGAMITQMRKEAGVNEAVTAESISKSGDSNAADALTRVSGVSVTQGKYVFIRGLGERYSSTQVNGSAVGTPESNKRVVPLDLFPSSVLQNIIVQKTFTPDMEGEFAGGVVKINTSDFSEDNGLRQSISMGSRSSSGDYLTYKGGGWDFLGFDDDTRALPAEIAKYDHAIDRNNLDVDQRRELSKSFIQDWTPESSDLPANWSYAGVYNRRLDLFGAKGGFLVGGSLSNSYNSLDRFEAEYKSGRVSYAYDVQESRREVLGGVNASYSLELDEYNKDKLKFSFLGTKNTTDIVKLSGGPNEDFGVDYVQKYDLGYIERSVTQSVIQGNHTLLGRNLLDWNFGYSTAVKDEPNRRFYTYQQQLTGDGLELGGRSQYPFQRLFGDVVGTTRSGKLDWSVPLGVSETSVSKLKFGYAYMNKDQNSTYRRLGFTCTRGGNCPEDRTFSADDLMFGEDGEARYIVEEITLPSDGWFGSHHLGAGYLMLDASLTPWMRLIAGSRYEESSQDVTTYNRFAVGSRPTETSNSETRWFPSLNAIFTIKEDYNIRAAWSQTVNRPELRELAATEYYDWDKGWSIIGNKDLHTSYLESLDLRGEYYPGPGEMVAVSAFYKDFDRPIMPYQVTLSTGTAEKPFNGDRGWLRGFEGEARINLHSAYRALDWLADVGGTPSHGLRKWGVLANFSFIESEAVIDGNTIKPSAQIDLPNSRYSFPGQSDYSVNWGLFLQLDRLETNLVYQTFGPRLVLLSDNPNIEGMKETPAAELDLLCSYSLSDITKIKFSAKNLLDEPTRYRIKTGELTRETRKGVSFSLGISYAPGNGAE